jgi:hypothetical protein
MTPGLAEKLCFTAIATTSYAQAAAVAARWGVAVDDAVSHQQVQRAGERAEQQAQARTAASATLAAAAAARWNPCAGNSKAGSNGAASSGRNPSVAASWPSKSPVVTKIGTKSGSQIKNSVKMHPNGKQREEKSSFRCGFLPHCRQNQNSGYET